MTNDKGVSMSEWLKRVDRNQNLDKLSDIENIDLSDFLRFFLSMGIQPGLDIGYYDPKAKEYVLGPVDGVYGEPWSDVSSTSLGTHTFTMAAGYRYEIIGMYTKNSTRAITGLTVDFTLTGYTAQQIVDTGSGGSVQGENAILIGQGGVDTGVFSPAGPVWATAASTFLITQGNFVASDTVEYGIFGRRYPI
jgi:hypothetical protein